jgi:hypothetical protein
MLAWGKRLSIKLLNYECPLVYPLVPGDVYEKNNAKSCLLTSTVRDNNLEYCIDIEITD